MFEDEHENLCCSVCGEWLSVCTDHDGNAIYNCPSCALEGFDSFSDTYDQNIEYLDRDIEWDMKDFLARRSNPHIENEVAFGNQFDREINWLPDKLKSSFLLPGLFRSIMAGSLPISVVDGIVRFPSHPLSPYRALLERQTLVVGFHGRGIVARYAYNQEFGQDSELGINGLEILGYFNLSAIATPDETFVQLRLAEHELNVMILGDVLATYVGATFAVKILSGNCLREVASNGTNIIKERREGSK